MRGSDNLYIKFRYEPELLKNIEPLKSIENNDFWLRPVDNMQHYWAVIHPVNDDEFRVVFFTGNSKAFDELIFESLADAEQALSGYGFDLWEYMSDDSKSGIPRPDLPLFIDKRCAFPVPNEYSSGGNLDHLGSAFRVPDMYSEGKIQAISKQFHMAGSFYKRANDVYRKYVDIKLDSTSVVKPQLMVVMMNPGKFLPLGGDIENASVGNIEKCFDPTLNQILRVMYCASLDCVRVINLSDRRAPKSLDFFSFLESKEADEFPHSIFDQRRKDELAELFVSDVPVIYAWGVSPKLSQLSKMAVKAIDERNPIGLKKEGKSNAYYHPLRPSTPKQKEWVRKVLGMLRLQHDLF